MSTLTELMSSPTTAGSWKLVPERSTITFKAKSMWGLLPVKGKFTEFSGDGQTTAAGSVSGRIDVRAASLSTGIAKRDEHLRSADFFDVEKFPDITVQVTAAEPTGADAANLLASAVVTGTTQSIDLPATVRVLADGAIQISAQTTVDREKFGVTGNMVGMIGSAVTLSADVLFTRVPS